MIVICEVCGSYFCPSACPNFKSKPKVTCSCCDVGIEAGESYYLLNEKALCTDCARELFPRELAELLDCYFTEDFFFMLGATLREA